VRLQCAVWQAGDGWVAVGMILVLGLCIGIALLCAILAMIEDGRDGRYRAGEQATGWPEAGRGPEAGMGWAPGGLGPVTLGALLLAGGLALMVLAIWQLTP
jgi:hypothetical protein